MKYAFIREYAGCWPVAMMCRVLGVSRSGFYEWRDRPESPRAVANQMLLGEIRRLKARHHNRYGSPRMHAALRAEGHRCSRGHVARLMRLHGIQAVAGQRFRPATTDSGHLRPVAPNLLAQNFQAAAPNRIWLSDITYIATGEGWLYLAAVLDLATRKVIGWAMRDHMRTELPLCAVDGSAAATTRARSHLSLGPWQPICRRDLSTAVVRDPGQSINEPQRVLLR